MSAIMTTERTSMSGDIDRAVASHVARLDHGDTSTEFARQGSFVSLSEFLPADVTAQLAACARALLPGFNRNYLPGHKKGAQRQPPYVIDRRGAGDRGALSIEDAAARSSSGPAASRCCRARPTTRMRTRSITTRSAGDHIGWHYDTSYYDGRRYTVLLGVHRRVVVSRLDYELHTRDEGRRGRTRDRCRIPPGGLVFFDGDKPASSHHAVGGRRDARVVDVRVRDRSRTCARGSRMLSNLKDAVRVLRLPATAARRDSGPVNRVDRSSCCRSGRRCSSCCSHGRASARWRTRCSRPPDGDSRWSSRSTICCRSRSTRSRYGVLLPPVNERDRRREPRSIARWVGESVNSLLPAGQLGGPVAMARQLAQRGVADGRRGRGDHRQRRRCSSRSRRSCSRSPASSVFAWAFEHDGMLGVVCGFPFGDRDRVLLTGVRRRLLLVMQRGEVSSASCLRLRARATFARRDWSSA